MGVAHPRDLEARGGGASALRYFFFFFSLTPLLRWLILNSQPYHVCCFEEARQVLREGQLGCADGRWRWSGTSVSSISCCSPRHPELMQVQGNQIGKEMGYRIIAVDRYVAYCTYKSLPSHSSKTISNHNANQQIQTRNLHKIRRLSLHRLQR